MIELERIYGILSSFLGESKQGGYVEGVEQYQFNCPYCADEKGHIDGKFNLEISFTIFKFHCWSCNSSGRISKLIKKWGGKNCLSEYLDIIKDLKQSKLYEFDDRQIEEKSETQLELPSTYKKINLKTCQDKRLKAYLKKRHIDQWTINKFKIGYTTWNDEEKSWANRIIIPSYDDFENLNFFVGRDFLPEKPDAEFKRPKYKNCDADKKEIVFQESLIDWDSDIILLEGVFDAILSPNAISLLGKTLTEDCCLYTKLYEKSNAKIIICLDGDTKIEETKKIYSLLNKGRLKGKIWYIDMINDCQYKDFSETFENEGLKGVVEMLKKIKKFSEIDLTF